MTTNEKIQKSFNELVETINFNSCALETNELLDDNTAFKVYKKIVEIAEILDSSFAHIDEHRNIIQERIERIITDTEKNNKKKYETRN